MKKVCVYSQMTVVMASKLLDTVEMSSVAAIPSGTQVCEAISMLCKEQEKQQNKFVYIKFPFGMMDYDGLKSIQAYHDSVQHKQMMLEEKNWLHDVDKLGSEIGISMSQINQHFEEKIWTPNPDKQHTSVQSLVGNRWLSNYDIDSIFEIINRKYDNIIGFVCKSSQFMYSFADLREKADKTIKKKITITKILVALNIRYENGEYLISDGERTGTHWSLLMVELSKNTAYYGDSLAWSLPANLTATVEASLKVISSDLSIDITKCLQNIIVLQQSGVSNKGNVPFYPLQTCSNMCGIIVVCMSAIVSECWNSWVTWSKPTDPPFISKPSANGYVLDPKK